MQWLSITGRMLLFLVVVEGFRLCSKLRPLIAVTDSHRPISEVARELTIGEPLLGVWIRAQHPKYDEIITYVPYVMGS